MNNLKNMFNFLDFGYFHSCGGYVDRTTYYTVLPSGLYLKTALGGGEGGGGL